MQSHDPYCKAFYPALLPVENCTWCYVIREVRRDEYLKAWNEGFEIGFGEGREMSLNEYKGYMSLNEGRPKYEDIDKEARAQRIQRGIDKWEEDVDIAYWQGYNNALIEKYQQESDGTQ